jgi:hypothetical protein
MLYKIFIFNGILFLIISCFPSNNLVYKVKKISQPAEINSNWNKEPWKSIPALHINNYMGEAPDYKLIVEAKVAYDDNAIYVIYLVKDQFVSCVLDQYQDPVSRESTVEFFFTPGSEISKGYFNLEINCGGTSLFKFQKAAGKGQVKIPKSTFDKIEIAHSLPRVVYPEIKEPVSWTIEFRIPFNILDQFYDSIAYPGPGVIWKANFYKIASKTSHPHFLTWSFVDHPKPQFHLPEYFGTLKFQ